MIYDDLLVGGIPTPLKNMSSSVGMIIPNIWKNKIHVPNHQPNIYIYIYKYMSVYCSGYVMTNLSLNS